MLKELKLGRYLLPINSPTMHKGELLRISNNGASLLQRQPHRPPPRKKRPTYTARAKPSLHQSPTLSIPILILLNHILTASDLEGDTGTHETVEPGERAAAAVLAVGAEAGEVGGEGARDAVGDEVAEAVACCGGGWW